MDLDICLGNFRTVHTFIVDRDLTFECILGADFLKVNKAVMDFRNNTLHLGNSTIKIPNSDVSVSSDDAHSICFGRHGYPWLLDAFGHCNFAERILWFKQADL